jgi:hypothetical protein
MCVHNIERHLCGVEMEIVLGSHFQHAQVNKRVLVPGKADKAYLARLPRPLEW